MKLHHNPMSSACVKVLIVKDLLGLKIDLQHYEFSDLKNSAYLKLNPNGMVPAFEDGDFKLWESNAIIEYLSTVKAGGKLFPQDPKTRADISRWMFWQASHWSPAISLIAFENAFKKMFNMGAPDPVKLKEGEEKFQRFAPVLNNHLEGRTWLVGQEMTLADVSVGTPIIYADAGKVPWRQYPHIVKWYERLSALEAWKKNLPKFN